jgi:hypothetical protein
LPVSERENAATSALDGGISSGGCFLCHGWRYHRTPEDRRATNDPIGVLVSDHRRLILPRQSTDGSAEPSVMLFKLDAGFIPDT